MKPDMSKQSKQEETSLKDTLESRKPQFIERSRRLFEGKDLNELMTLVKANNVDINQALEKILNSPTNLDLIETNKLLEENGFDPNNNDLSKAKELFIKVLPELIRVLREQTIRNRIDREAFSYNEIEFFKEFQMHFDKSAFVKYIFENLQTDSTSQRFNEISVFQDFINCCHVSGRFLNRRTHTFIDIIKSAKEYGFWNEQVINNRKKRKNYPSLIPEVTDRIGKFESLVEKSSLLAHKSRINQRIPKLCKDLRSLFPIFNELKGQNIDPELLRLIDTNLRELSLTSILSESNELKNTPPVIKNLRSYYLDLRKDTSKPGQILEVINEETISNFLSFLPTNVVNLTELISIGCPEITETVQTGIGTCLLTTAGFIISNYSGLPIEIHRPIGIIHDDELENKELTIQALALQRNMFETICHELGHAYHLMTLNIHQTYTYLKIVDTNPITVDSFHESKQLIDLGHKYKEDFASTFSMFINNPFVLQEISEERYGFFFEIFRDELKNTESPFSKLLAYNYFLNSNYYLVTNHELPKSI